MMPIDKPDKLALERSDCCLATLTWATDDNLQEWSEKHPISAYPICNKCGKKCLVKEIQDVNGNGTLQQDREA